LILKGLEIGLSTGSRDLVNSRQPGEPCTKLGHADPWPDNRVIIFQDTLFRFVVDEPGVV
jgi:hypothetical protein